MADSRENILAALRKHNPRANDLYGAATDPQFWKDAAMNLPHVPVGIASQFMGAPMDIIQMGAGATPGVEAEGWPGSSKWLRKGWYAGREEGVPEAADIGAMIPVGPESAGALGGAKIAALAGALVKKKGVKSVGNLFDEITDPAKALAMAKSGKHIKVDPKSGKRIGAPPQVTSPQALTKVRRDVDKLVGEGSWNADWYLRQRELARALSSDPAKQSLFARGTSAYSPQAMPKVELPAFLRQHNQAMLTGEQVAPRTGAQSRNVARAYGDAHSTGQVHPGSIRLGKKTGPYAAAKDPTVPEGSLYKTASDIWHARAMGYGDDFSRGLTSQEHGFLTGENLLAGERATKAGVPVGQHGLIPHTPRTAQASTWGATRFRDVRAADQAKFNAQSRARTRYDADPAKWRSKNPGKGAPPKPVPIRSDEELRAYASGGLDTAMPNQTAYLTNEAVTGESVGHLPGMNKWPASERAAYTDAVSGATGRDPTIESLGMYSKKPVSTSGEFVNSQGTTELNPGWADPVAVSNTAGKGARMTPPDERKALDLAALTGGLMRGQEAGAWSRFHPQGTPGLRVRDMNAMAMEGATPAELSALRAHTGPQGLSVVDQGPQSLLTKFGDEGVVPGTAGELKSAMETSPVLSKRLMRGQLETGYEPALGGTAPGSGEATQALLGKIEGSGFKNVYERLDAGRWGTVAGAMNKIDTLMGEVKNIPLREDLVKLRKIVSESGFSGLRDYVKKYGPAGLPAIAGAGFLPALMNEPGGLD